jgi:hypothetical protein
MQWFALAILPNFVGVIAVLDKNRIGIPILLLPGQESPALQN